MQEELQIKKYKRRYNPFRNLLIRHYLTYVDKIFSVSNALKEVLERNGIQNVETVYNGIDVSSFPFESNPRGDYLLWIGRFTANKAPHLAIELARQAGIPLKMAAKLDQQSPKDIDYFNHEIKPLLKPGVAEWVGEIGHKEKALLYKDALAFLNPIQWDEPFGLTVAESMACGTPVIAYRRGSMPELIIDGETGFLIKPNHEDQFLAAIKKVGTIDRAKCRQHADSNFSVTAMTDGYLSVYEKLLAK